MYAVVEKATDNAVMIFRVEEMEQAAGLLEKRDVRLLGGKDVYSL